MSGVADLVDWQRQAQEKLRVLGMSLVAMGAAARYAGFCPDAAEALTPVAEAVADVLGDRAAEFAARLSGGGPARRWAAFLMLEPATGRLLPVAGFGFPDAAIWAPLADRTGFLGRLTAGKAPRLLADTAEAPDFEPLPADAAVGSAMFAPLSWNGAMIGTLYCSSSVPGTFGTDDLPVLGGFADLAALVWIARDGAALLRSRARERHAREPL